MPETIKFTDRNDVRELVRKKYVMKRTDTHEVKGSLKLSTFRNLLESHREKQFRLMLPNENAIPVCFHITEVAQIQKRFIDCGGKLHSTQTCQLQAWVWRDTEHRLLAGKMADVLRLASKALLLDEDLELEFEYEDTVISQYPVAAYRITKDEVILNLEYKHTDCLAKDVCLPSSLPLANGVSSCCGPSCC